MNDMENWFEKCASSVVNEGHFMKLCDRMKVGDVLWYATLQNLLTVDCIHNCAMDEPTYGFGKWTESWYYRGDEGSTDHLALVGTSPKVYKPLKLVFNCKYESQDTYKKVYIFSMYDADSLAGKYVWCNSVWNDIKHPNCGIRGDVCSSPLSIADLNGNRWGDNKRLRIMEERPSRPLVFLNEEDCKTTCNELNRLRMDESIKMLIKTLRKMSKEARDFMATYREGGGE